MTTTQTKRHILRWGDPPYMPAWQRNGGRQPGPDSQVAAKRAATWAMGPPALGRGPWRPVVDDLKARPGEWAVVAAGPVQVRSTAYDIKSGQLADFRPGGAFEARSYINDDGVYEVYARYLGRGGTAAMREIEDAWFQ